jgi:hypothetical protein
MRDADLLAGRGEAHVAAIVQPLRAIRKPPLEPATALVELADHDEQAVFARVHPCREAHDLAVERVDRELVFGGRHRRNGAGRTRFEGAHLNLPGLFLGG